jgi:hypothetical protein
MRVGNNPMKNQMAPCALPTRVATVITHLPNLAGYHAGRLEVVKACLMSMRRFGDVPVMVWDNGSGEELRAWLIDEYQPEWLMLSGNMGKLSARAMMVRMFPGETILGFTDDDMLFYPGWFKAHVDLLEEFPNVGMVSGWRVRVAFEWATDATMRWAQAHADVSVGQFISVQEEREYARCVGLDVNEHLKRSGAADDVLIEYQGMRAFATAQHCQFVAYAGRIAPFCVPSRGAMGAERGFDEAVDRAGMLRLTTEKRFARHMGNVLDEGLIAEMKGMGLG